MTTMPPPMSLESERAVVTVTVVGLAPGAADDEILVPPDVARAFGLVDDTPVVVRAGAASASATIRIVAKATGFHIAPRLAGQLALSPGLRLHVKYDAENSTLRFGPFVGILALRARRGPVYGDHEPFFQSLTRQGRSLAVPAFMFSPRDVRWQEGRINGYVFSGAARRPGRWRKLTVPLPDVVYDRIQTRRAEGRPSYIRFRRRLTQDVPTWFNADGFFDKWRLHTLLWENERLRPYLPETRRYGDGSDLEHMLRSYPVVYVKPVAGSLGEGILRLRRTSAGFHVSYEIGERPVTRHRGSLPALHGLIRRLTRGRPYIVQQGLPLARWAGRPFDVRILMQRDGKGDWAITKMFSRIAAPGGITSNLTRGADACNIHLLLRRVYGIKHRARLYRHLVHVGTYCAQEIARVMPGSVGELGLDLGMSRNGRVWLIEANSKPFLQMNREAGPAHTLRLSVRRPLQFAKHLAGY